jgi:probable HAF family extracellular repeat protein
MARLIFGRLVVSLLCLLVVAPARPGFAADQPSFKVSEVDPLKGDSYTQPTAINASGVVVGNSFGNGPIRALLWRKGESELLGPDSTTSFATGVTKGGTVVGYVTGQDSVDRAVTWKKGEQTALPSLGGASHAWGVNDRALVVGDSLTDPKNTSSQHACVWQSGKVTDLGTVPGGGISAALDVNAGGQIVGGAATTPDGVLALGGNGVRTAHQGVHAVLWQDGKITDLGTLPGGDTSLALAINDAGQIAGYSNLNNSPNFHAVLWESGKISDLGTLPGGTESWATGINAAGQVVGVSDSPKATADGRSTVAVRWDQGKIARLSDQIPADGGWGDVLEALAINDKGQIAADGLGGNVGYYGAVLTPVKPTAASTAASTAGSSEAGPVTIAIAEQNGSGVKGTASLQGSGDKTAVTLLVVGGSAGQAAAIHTGACGDDPKPEFPLTAIDPTGTSITVVSAALSDLLASSRSIVVNQGSDPADGTIAACGEISDANRIT